MTDNQQTQREQTDVQTGRQAERRYVPQIGARVRLRQFDDYNRYGLPAWTVLHVAGIADEQVTCIRSLTADGAQDGELVTVHLVDIEPPIGWQPRYTITVTADKVDQVLGWFRERRGIAVLQSHYMPSCPTAYAPADNQDTADWRFNGADREVIAAEQCDDVFRVVRLDAEYDAYALLPGDCKHCAGTGKRQRGVNAVLDKAAPPICERCNVRIGFSWDERWHWAGQCNQVPREAAECWVCDGKGKIPMYLAGMAPKQRKQAIKALEQAGWKVWYQRSGQLWRMERETVVKEWGQAVAVGEVAL